MSQYQIWSVIFLSVYYGVVIIFFFKVLLENKNPLKTQSYLILMVLLPVLGLLIYLFFGINFRKQKLFSRKGFQEQKIIQRWIKEYDNLLVNSTESVREYLHEKAKLPYLFWRNNYSMLTGNNSVRFLYNGEEKFPVLLEKLKQARHHIHMEYYLIEDDDIGNRVIDVLCQKSIEGITVRLIADDLGCNKIKDRTWKKLRKSGVKVKKYNPVIFTSLANRVNYRDHRKIVVIDGEMAFVGGINIADRYINREGKKGMYWRDTHCLIEGEATYSLQVLFMLNWYFVSKELLYPTGDLFPRFGTKGRVVTSIISSDPDSDFPNLMEAYFGMITSATREILISTPYFIPNESVLTALKTAAKGGVKVVLLLPGVADTFFVHAASLTFIGELLRNDIQVYYYTKGMIHSKIMIIDEELSTVGTANMDYRSFDNNAEVNAVFFDEGVARELKKQFEKDLAHARQVDYIVWKGRPFREKIIGSLGRLVAPLL